jgi:hypothetical protein
MGLHFAKPSSPLTAKATLWLKGGEWASLKSLLTIPCGQSIMVSRPPKRNEGRVVHTDLSGAFLVAPRFGEGLDLSITSTRSRLGPGSSLPKHLSGLDAMPKNILRWRELCYGAKNCMGLHFAKPSSPFPAKATHPTRLGESLAGKGKLVHNPTITEPADLIRASSGGAG